MICDLLREGNTRKAAAECAGVTYDTAFKNWYEAGSKLPPESDEPLRSFFDDVNQAESEIEARYTRQIEENALGYQANRVVTWNDVVYQTEQYVDPESGKVLTRKVPVTVTRTRTTLTCQRDLRAPMEWLKRRRRADYGDHVRTEVSGPDGGSIAIAIDPATARKKLRELLETPAPSSNSGE